MADHNGNANGDHEFIPHERKRIRTVLLWAEDKIERAKHWAWLASIIKSWSWWIAGGMAFLIWFRDTLLDFVLKLLLLLKGGQ